MFSFKIVAILAVISFASFGQSLWIESPKVTNWGVWGEPEYCNTTEHVYGFRIKVQQDQGILDDSALNSVELHCVPNNNSIGQRRMIKSLEGSKGAWGSVLECPTGHYAIGFEMRTEAPTLFDNTAANNIRMYCSDGQVLEGYGMDWGSWTGPLFCPSSMKICGLRVQVEEAVLQPPKGGTGVNNVDMWCCDRHD